MSKTLCHNYFPQTALEIAFKINSESVENANLFDMFLYSQQQYHQIKVFRIIESEICGICLYQKLNNKSIKITFSSVAMRTHFCFMMPFV